MSRYETTFAQLKERNEIAFIPFAVSGDPDPRTGESVLQTYVEAGADILEIGYPFSDPMADGPVNQRASQRAIASGLTPTRFFAMIGRLRSRTDIPIGLLLYANTVHHAGYERFCSRAADAGIDSILVADLPPEEAGPWLETLQKNGLCSVFIVSELTSKDRIRYICANTTGFVYVVSRLGTTGEQKDLSANLAPTLMRLRRQTSLPLCVGFGLSRPEHISAVKKAGADGAIVGSALVRQVESHRNDPERMLATIRRRVRNYKRATRG